MNQIFLNTKEDCDWLRSTHLNTFQNLNFKSFVLFGNEDAPEKVRLYESNDPLYNDNFQTIILGD